MVSSHSHSEKFQDHIENEILTNIYPSPTAELLESRCKKAKNTAPKTSQISTLKVKPLHGTYENVLSTSDGRKQVHTTAQWPYCVHGIIEGRFGDDTFKGTGTLIGPNIVLTAGHNLYFHAKRVYASLESMRFMPGINGKLLPFGNFEVEKYFISPRFVEEEEEDYGILILKEPTGDTIGYFGLACLESAELVGKKINITGYPEDKAEANSMWEMEGSVHEVDEKQGFLYYKIDTGRGQSGSGVFYKNNGLYFVCGVHVRGCQGMNIATLVTRKIYDQIYQWIQKSVKKELLLYLKNQGDFGGHKINAECLSLLLNYNFENLGRLDFRFEKIQAAGAKLLGQNSSWVNLTHLYLSENMIGDEGATALAKNTSWIRLVKLDLSGNNIGDEGAKALAQNSSWRELSQLNLRFNNIGDLGAATFAQNTSWIKISQLSLSNNQIGDTGVLAFAQNTSWANLSKLILNWNKIGDKGAQALGQNISWVNLTHLDLFHNHIGDKGAKELGQNISWAKLRYLDVSDNKIGDEGAKGLGENTSWSNLGQLSFSENQVGNEGAKGLGENTSWKKLLKLHLRFNRIGDEGVKGLAKNTSWTNLSQLYLTENKITSKGAKWLAKNTSWVRIAEIDLANNKIGDEGTKALAKNTSWINLSQLDLSENKIGDEGAEALAQNTSWTNLSTLILNWNNIGDTGVKSLALTNISEFQLSWNPISSEGVRILKSPSFAKPSLCDFYWIPSDGKALQIPISLVISIWKIVENSPMYKNLKFELQSLYQSFCKGEIPAKRFQDFIQNNSSIIYSPLDLNQTIVNAKEDYEEVSSPPSILNENLLSVESANIPTQSDCNLNGSNKSVRAGGVQFPLKTLYMYTQNSQENTINN